MQRKVLSVYNGVWYMTCAYIMVPRIGLKICVMQPKYIFEPTLCRVNIAQF